MRRQLTIACGDYDRTHALVDGSVNPEGLVLNWLDLPHLEIWTRMLNYCDFDASEISLASFTIAKTMGKPLVGIPVFPGRAFRHSYIFVNANSGIREPQDLMGKGSVWESSSSPRPSGSEAFCSMSTVFLLRRSDGDLDAAEPNGDEVTQTVPSAEDSRGR